MPWLAWLAPVPWLWLIQRPGGTAESPSSAKAQVGKPPVAPLYFALWLAGFAHWLLMLEGIRLAHPALYAGWIALSAYLGVYLPAFVGLTRVAVNRLKWSVVIAAPVVWVGLELVRGHLITGFSMGLFAHTQAEFPRLIQVADLAGGYTLSFVIVLIAACIARMAWQFTWWPVMPAGAALAATLLYGQWRLSQMPPAAGGPTVQVALIQGALDTVFTELTTERARDTFDHYRQLTTQAVHKRPNLDLVVWPESSFVVTEPVIEEPLSEQPGIQLSAQELRSRLKAAQEDFQTVLANQAQLASANSDAEHAGTLLIVNTATVAYGAAPPRTYNAALLADRDGKVVGRYYKTHPVMFGEYIPFAAWLPWLYTITPMSGGLARGEGPTVFEVGGLRMAPNICFESTIPHLIRGQLRELDRRGTPADVLLNVTNDGWFWGTAMLDLHFRCGVFRAVENRKPLLVAANTGISTWVDGRGIIRERGDRRQPQVLFAEVQADGRISPYQYLGDWPAWLCAAFCMGMAIIAFRRANRVAVNAAARE
jgi:apolipoprotein N-acyltransferase